MAPKTKKTTAKKTSGAKGTTVLFKDKEKSPGSRPVSVYCERLPDGSLKIWYHAEDTKDYGRVAETETNSLTKMQTLIGYTYTIPYTEEKKKQIIAMKGPNTKFYHKDGETDKSVTEEKF